METGSNETIKELELVIRSILIARPTVAKASQLLRECEEELGQIPLRKLGFKNFIDLLKSMPSVCQLQRGTSLNPEVIPVQSQASRHIDQLVSKQKVTTSRRGSSARVQRRRTVVAPPRVPQNQNQGFNARDSSDYMKNSYNKNDTSRNGFHNVKARLTHTDDTMDRRGYRPGGASTFTNHTTKEKGIPAEDVDDFYDDDLYDGGPDMDSEEILAQQAFRQFGVVENENSRYSSRPPLPCNGASASGVSFRRGVSDQKAFNTDDGCNISHRMITNFRQILDNHPEGIWSTELLKLYYNEYGERLDLRDLNFSSVTSLAAALPSVFLCQREGTHDVKLYDARHVSQQSLGGKQEILSTDSGIPQTIIDNIKNLMKTYSYGFRTKELPKLYSETYNKPLRFQELGFGTLNELLMQLTNDVTLIPSNDYYLMLPKHQRLSFESFEPTKTDERLKLPPEALNVPFPEGVLKFGEKIPMQCLSEVKYKGPDDPLLEQEIMVAEVISPVYFYMTLGDMHERLESMMVDLHKFYSWEEEYYKIPVPHIIPNLYCAIKYDDRWHRAKIVRVKENDTVEVEYIDYGTPQTVDFSVLRYLSRSFAKFPAQAICAKLIGVKPTKGRTKFPPEDCNEFLNLVSGKRMVAHVYQVSEKVKNKQEKVQFGIILFDVANPSAVTVVNDFLIESGLASPILLQLEDCPEIDLLPDKEIRIENYSPPVNGRLPPQLASNSTSLPEDVLPPTSFSSRNLSKKCTYNLKIYSRYVLKKYPTTKP